MDKPWKVISAFVGVFMAGAVFGGLFTLRSSGGRIVPKSETPPPRAEPVVTKGQGRAPGGQAGTATAGRSPAGQASAGNLGVGRIAPALMRSFTQRLNPTTEQRERIRPLVNRAAEDLNRLQREHVQDTVRVSERLYADVAAVLTPQQRTQLEKMRQETLERVRREREKRGETPGAGEPNRGGVNPVARPKDPAKARPATP